MCSSKPKIPNSKTPPAPGAPEPTPDAPMIGGDRRAYLRSRGLAIMPRPDLSGLGNQTMGMPTPVNTLMIGPGRGATPKTAVQIAEDNIRAQQVTQQASTQRRQERLNGRRR